MSFSFTFLLFPCMRVRVCVREREGKRRWEEPFSGNEKTFSPPSSPPRFVAKGEGKAKKKEETEIRSHTPTPSFSRKKKAASDVFCERGTLLSFKICEIAFLLLLLLKMPSSLFQLENWREERGTMAGGKKGAKLFFSSTLLLDFLSLPTRKKREPS